MYTHRAVDEFLRQARTYAAPGDRMRQRGGARVARRVALRGATGTLARNSSSHTVAGESLGARQSLRGESEPPEPTLGPFGIAERLNWLVWKNRSRNTSSQ
jgi:hypothetical protein